ncbi:hypothetical protein ALC60_10920 [Trachymyrmex zeteki]|uniref:Uncharacterized protein n=1 Tax=Mycetomoellerius zeteki TaxID=64791 RepID=A0A151WQA8_9HYME|nr:hypothetical protein ALC60_10920 [Trachymyrmex zeteki]
MRKTGYEDNHRAMRRRKNHARKTRFVLMKAVEWKLRLRSTSVIAIIAPDVNYLGTILIMFLINHTGDKAWLSARFISLILFSRADDNGSTLHSRSTMGPITDRSHFAEAFLPVKYVRNVRLRKSNVSNGKMPYVDVTPIVNIRSSKSLEAIERELKVRVVRTASRTPEFSLLRECNELAIPSNWLHLRGSRIVTSAFVIASTRTRISRKRFFEFAPTVRVTPERSSINNTPCHRTPCVPTRDREVVTVYYTSFNWHQSRFYPIQSSLSQTDISIFVTTVEMALVDTKERGP